MAFSSDLDQITRAAAGERQAVSALVNRYSPGVLALATRMLGDRAEAEDVTQETFIRAWKALPDWEPRAKFSTWLQSGGKCHCGIARAPGRRLDVVCAAGPLSG